MEQEVLMWLVGIVGTLFSTMVVYILNNINNSIKDVRKEMSDLNVNLVRIDRRVAYLEGKMAGHPDVDRRVCG